MGFSFFSSLDLCPWYIFRMRVRTHSNCIVHWEESGQGSRFVPQSRGKTKQPADFIDPKHIVFNGISDPLKKAVFKLQPKQWIIG